MWGCDHRDDSRAYAGCPVIWEFASRRLRLPTPSVLGERRVAFYGLHRCWHKRDFSLALRHGVLVYVAYRAHLAWLHSGSPSPAPPGLLRQALAEATRGDPASTRILDTIWVK